MNAGIPRPLWKLTERGVPEPQRRDALRAYANDNGWRPSDEILWYPETEGFANGHLLVEHGLDNTAVISFLPFDQQFQQLRWADQHRLLGISYNNLVDWHLFPDRDGMLHVYNRVKPIRPNYSRVQDDPNAWRAEAFDILIGRRQSPNLPALDDALIRTVSEWRRIIAAESNLVNDTGPISELFNAIFFVRARWKMISDTRTKRAAAGRRIARHRRRRFTFRCLHCNGNSNCSLDPHDGAATRGPSRRRRAAPIRRAGSRGSSGTFRKLL